VRERERERERERREGGREPYNHHRRVERAESRQRKGDHDEVETAAAVICHVSYMTCV
jgi:hypothetical protein